MKLVFSGKRTPISQITDGLRRNSFISTTKNFPENQSRIKIKIRGNARKRLEERLCQKNNHIKEQPDEKNSFLPNHPVTNENKPGKVRPVANASSVFQGQSLNSNLLKGPDLLSNLTGVILRFRENKIALSADIKQTFMQVKVAPEDRKFLRFLWNNDGRIETYVMMVVNQSHFWSHRLTMYCLICFAKNCS